MKKIEQEEEITITGGWETLTTVIGLVLSGDNYKIKEEKAISNF